MESVGQSKTDMVRVLRGGKNESKNIFRGVEDNEKFVNTIRRMVERFALNWD